MPAEFVAFTSEAESDEPDADDGDDDGATQPGVELLHFKLHHGFLLNQLDDYVWPRSNNF